MTKLKKGLVGHWTMDDADTSGGTLYDSSAYDNHATLNGGITQSASGRISEAYSFDGVDDIVTTNSNVPSSVSNEVSISFWYKPPTVDWSSTGDGTSARVVAGFGAPDPFYGQTNPDGFVIGVDATTNSVPVSIDGYDNKIVSDFTMSGNQWNQITVTAQSDGTVTIYNRPDTTYTETVARDSTISTNNIFDIGSSSSASSREAAGEIDDVRLYNRVLSSNEVSALYNMRSQRQKTNDLAKGLVGHWTMDDADTSGGTLYDSSAYGNHGVLGGVNDPPLTSQSGQINESYEFIGESDSVSSPDGDYVEIDSSPEFDTTEFSACAWVYVPSDSNNDGDDIVLHNRYQPGFWLQPEASYVTDSSNSYPIFTSTTPPSDTWYHICTTYDGSTHKIYYNGIQENSQTQTTPGSVEKDLQIGTWQNKTSNHFDGKLDDVRFYNRVLSSDEINRIYNER